MRSWYPIPPDKIDDIGIRAEHKELHTMAKSINGINTGWLHHPETKRWIGCSHAMKRRHDSLLPFIKNHKTPWPDEFLVSGEEDCVPGLVEPLEDMLEKLNDKIKRRSGSK